MPRRELRIVTGTVLMLAMGCGAVSEAHAGSIRLRSQVQVADLSVVRLGEIAELDGDDAMALADHVIATNLSRAVAERGDCRLEIDEVLERLRDAGAPMGRLSFAGRACTLRPSGAQSPHLDGHNRRDRDSSPPAIVALDGPATIRTRIAECAATMLGVEADALRLGFEPRDAPVLDIGEWDRRIVVEPMSSPHGARLQFRVRVFDAETELESYSISADVLIRREVVVVRHRIDRREVVTAESIGMQTLWIPPTGAAPIESVEAAAGQIAQVRLESGQMLRSTDLEPPILVKRGELVTVHCLRGALAVKTEARAMQDGREGEVIELRKDVSRETFVARVIGRGLLAIDEQFRQYGRD